VGISSSEPIELTADNIRALELHSDVPEKGFISSSNPTLNKNLGSYQQFLSC